MEFTHYTESLLGWYKNNKRVLPWRQTKDPYKIWLSEVILQQTRILQGLPYYEKFINKIAYKLMDFDIDGHAFV